MEPVKDARPPMVYRPFPAPQRAKGAGLRGSDVLTLNDFSPGEIAEILDATGVIKREPARGSRVLAGRSAIMLFEKPSLRTRVTFEVGISKLGGHAMYFDHSAHLLGEREAVHDYGKNLERWVDLIIARVFSQQVLNELAASAGCPVINALSDVHHPCQALADVFTLRERIPDLRRAHLAYIGDGNNVCHSLMHACALTGASISVITPAGYEPMTEFVDEAQAIAATTGSTVRVTNDVNAVRGCHAVYTDVWVSMGQADMQGKRMKAFKDYQANAQLMAIAGPDAYFMHCLPAHRGVEVTDEVIDSPRSIVYDQAENRMHAQNGLMACLFGAAL
ncbi:MAG: ornithine carbamoyltransferase [Phycisphaerales bacterium]